jgi:DNA-binding Lrp family transcriptional regulator
MAKIDLDEAKTWVLSALALHAHDLTRAMANRYQASSSTASAALKQLELAGVIRRSGPINRPVFEAASNKTVMQSYSFPLGDAGDIWARDFLASLSEQLSASQRELLKTSFMALANNAAQHSRGTNLHVVLEQTAEHVEMSLQDNGAGLFKQLVNAKLAADIAAAVALLTTLQAMPNTSADMSSFSVISGLANQFDYFLIEANGVHFPLAAAAVESQEEELFEQGTTVIMELSLRS